MKNNPEISQKIKNGYTQHLYFWVFTQRKTPIILRCTKLLNSLYIWWTSNNFLLNLKMWEQNVSLLQTLKSDCSFLSHHTDIWRSSYKNSIKHVPASDSFTSVSLPLKLALQRHTDYKSQPISEMHTSVSHKLPRLKVSQFTNTLS